MNWRVLINGLWETAKDIFCQKILASHLPSTIPLPDLTGLSCIVTGATSGIGLYTARELAKAGAHVCMACRNTKIALQLVQEWQKQTSGKPMSIKIMELDLLSFASVRAFAASWESTGCPIHILINNAGILQLGEPEKMSKDGFEQHIQVNHLAPALLTLLLLPSLLKGAPSRIINVNTVAHHNAVVDSEYLNADFRVKSYSSLMAYASSKLSQLMFLNVLSRKLPANAQLGVIAVHPGIVSTNITRGFDPRFSNKSFWRFDAEQGARSVLFCATEGEVEQLLHKRKNQQESGFLYYSYNCKPAKVSAQVADLNNSFRVWTKTLQLLGLSNECIQRSIDQIIPPAY
ncbi:hypothetical protein SUGI_0247850 [Cryptomeria japonica]|uniref:dehydrogenase/reductase SDR family member FEY n=1 Tax=Cryptomeria japonica TaxID=3369 RepID=UPI002408E27F|nr:dehydrogenase/reductase SDR family member FEY [Cryptomeria japonica]GLJ15152.1 hypothetical protein SUGI_0247850 [Cryptomeria japonica]